MLRQPILLLLIIIILSAGITGCSPAAAPAAATPTTAVQEATAPPTETLPPPTAAPETATATAEPTATVEPTATAVPTATAEPTPAALQAEVVQGWCLPENTAVSLTADPLNPPATAKVGESSADGLVIRNLPGSACVFSYKLNAPAAEGLRLQVYELRPEGAAGTASPWLTADLAPVEGSPDTVAAVLRHSYIVAFPYWEVTYQFALVDANGSELRRDTVNLRRWESKPCWNGRLPNPLTLRCPLQQDLHPWDAGYGTPMPTPENRED